MKIWLAIATVLALLTAPSRPRAETVAVAPFEGGRLAKRVQKQVVKLVASKHELARDPAAALVVVRGVLSGKRLAITIVTVADDARLASFELLLQRRRLKSKSRRQFVVELRKALAKARGAGADIEPTTPPEPEPEREREPEPEPDPEPEPESEPEPVPIAKKRAVATAAPEARVATSAPPASGDGAPVMRLAVGASFVARRFRFRGASARYDGTAVPGVIAAAELYPLAWLSLDGLGVGGFIDRVVSLTSSFSESGESFDLPTTQMSWGGHLRYRIGAAPHRFELAAIVGFRRISFVFDTASAAGVTIRVPDASYDALDPGLELSIPLGGALAISASGRYLHILEVAEITDMDAYGNATAWGFDAGAAVELAPTSRFSLRASAQLTQIELDFDETGALSMDGPFARAKERFLGGNLSAAVRF